MFSVVSHQFYQIAVEMQQRGNTSNDILTAELRRLVEALRDDRAEHFGNLLQELREIDGRLATLTNSVPVRVRVAERLEGASRELRSIRERLTSREEAGASVSVTSQEVLPSVMQILNALRDLSPVTTGPVAERLEDIQTEMQEIIKLLEPRTNGGEGGEEQDQ